MIRIWRTYNSDIDFVWTLIGEKSFGNSEDWILRSWLDVPEPRGHESSSDNGAPIEKLSIEQIRKNQKKT
ncbi:hypothetical protein A2U01_0038983, partial [Trifolium medium]|nr:hypothetical protein [Trifolium medium]